MVRDLYKYIYYIENNYKITQINYAISNEKMWKPFFPEVIKHSLRQTVKKSGNLFTFLQVINFLLFDKHLLYFSFWYFYVL